jgi:hemolysin III
VTRAVDRFSGLPRPSLRGWLHAGGFLIALPASIALVWWAGEARLLASIYAASLLLVLGVSASYHLFARTPRQQLVMARIDRAAIFLVIAGTYSVIIPITVPAPWSGLLLALVWLLAALAAAGRATGRMRRTSSAMYVVIGWLAIFVLPWMAAYSVGLTVWIAIGGTMFTIGAILFALKRPVAWPHVFGFHEVFHAFTLAGFATHFGCVLAALAAVRAAAG